jgi:hypothetical protein
MQPSSVYEIRVKGYLEDVWSDWFNGMMITHIEAEETLLTGPIVDQSALFGLLNNISSLNLTLISVNLISRPRQS